MTRHLRLTLAALTLVFGLAAFSGSASAQARSSHFGLGGTVGDPFGLTIKLRTNSAFAVQFLAGWSGWGYNDNWDGSAFQLSADFLWSLDLKSLQRSDFSFYFGVGPQVELVSWNNSANDHSDVFFGARVPLGLDFDFKSRPLDVFVELAPGFLIGDTWDGDNDADVFFEVDFVAGARYWF